MPERYSNIVGELKGKKLKTARGWALKESIRGLWRCSTEKEGRVFFAEWYSWAIRCRLESVKKAYGYRNKDRFKDDILFHCAR